MDKLHSRRQNLQNEVPIRQEPLLDEVTARRKTREEVTKQKKQQTAQAGRVRTKKLAWALLQQSNIE